LLLSDFDYELPPEAIAQTPLSDRAASKLLHLDRRTGEIRDRVFREVVDILQPGDLLVVNNTRVTALRLFGRRPTGAQVELLLLEEESAGIYTALARPGRRLRPGATVEFDEGLTGVILADLDGARKRVRFEPAEGLADRLAKIGRVPLPPYITSALADAERYQTVYAVAKGSAAAPTAGLHFTPEILRALRAKGVEVAEVTLDVSIDTFRPVADDDPENHRMHGENCSLSPATARAVQACRGRIIAVGTTSARTLESFAIGRKKVESGSQVTRLFIRPDYDFQVVDGMFTNFHMPRTTMLLMVAALASPESIRKSYRHALGSEYRFLSFGDSMLIV
jgi:S-adenosylmethionine:tRNA ribosyltransferase-isomerase